MMIARTAAIAAMAVSLTAAGAAQAPAKPAPAQRGACFHMSQTNGFSASGDRAVNIRVGIKDVYQLTLFAPCLDVDWSQHIALKTHGSSWICEGNGLDYEVVTHATGIGAQRCQVTTVHKLTEAEIAALPRRERP